MVLSVNESAEGKGNFESLDTVDTLSLILKLVIANMENLGKLKLSWGIL